MKVRANGLMIEVDDQGPRDAPVVLLVMGLGMQLTGWPDELVALLLAQGFRVVRFDNRDAGLSEGFDHVGVPSIPLNALRHFLRLPVRSPYALKDMAADAVGVLDALGVARAHIVGASLGGMICQHIAAAWPGRVASVALIMTTSGSRRLPGPTGAARRALLSQPANREHETLIAHSIKVFTAIGSPDYRLSPADMRERVAASIARAQRPQGSARQLLAIAADGDRTPMLGRIQAPTQVIHGILDPLVPVENGHDLVRRIPGALGDFIEGMGHDLPQPLLARISQGIASNVRRAG
ncbi:alpha/beta fold hydrolase [Scleromatobacter humisilvae]|uniref:Alpha/beta fold hydrolase n=1 Tax=Scleromatobacter humisilvae TaxID=2897159 RepID=A0A9X1YMB0_9BURK|nr:alpha/beta hydrolase [Scleromatobacter humisilvae]MCK9688095.1 alpha/beta fold hydrolase [Scleromatobacter humisilvae]